MRFAYKQVSIKVYFLLMLIAIAGMTVALELRNSDNNSKSGPANTDKENLYWEKSPLYPTDVNSYDNGTYSLELNNRLQIKFIRLNDDRTIQWPQTESGKTVISVKSDTLSANLSKALRNSTTASGTHPLKITKVQQADGKFNITFNNRLTLAAVELKQDESRLSWPSLDFNDQEYDIIGGEESLKKQILSHLKNNQTTTGEDGKDQTDLQIPENGVRAEVIKVFDGDTIKVRLMDGTDRTEIIRLQGIDCPESSRNEKCINTEYREGMSCEEEIKYGKRATKIAKKWLGGNYVVLAPGGDNEDFERGHYDRLIAYVHLINGEDYGLKMVKNGYCKDTSKDYSHPRGYKYRRQEAPLKPLR
ncbi:MAG: thermonuclease family protein [bacterium]